MFTVSVSYRYDDLEHLRTCFDGWDVELIQLGPRHVTGWAAVTALPPVRLIRVHAGRSVVIRGTVPPIGDCLMLSPSIKASVRWLGQRIGIDRFALVGRGARIDLFLPGEATLCIIVSESLASISPRRVQMRAVASECFSELVRHAAFAADRTESQSRSGLPYGGGRGLAGQIRIALETSAVVPIGTGTRGVRAIAVARACRFIASNLGKPIGLTELCRHCGVGTRTLEYGFRQFYDTTPIGFIKNQRLTRTHSALTQLCAERASISEIARRLGFTHMGQYAQDYRTLFGETPSMTLQRVRRSRDALSGAIVTLRGPRLC